MTQSWDNVRLFCLNVHMQLQIRVSKIMQFWSSPLCCQMSKCLCLSPSPEHCCSAILELSSLKLRSLEGRLLSLCCLPCVYVHPSGCLYVFADAHAPFFGFECACSACMDLWCSADGCCSSERLTLTVPKTSFWVSTDSHLHSRNLCLNADRPTHHSDTCDFCFSVSTACLCVTALWTSP